MRHSRLAVLSAKALNSASDPGSFCVLGLGAGLQRKAVKCPELGTPVRAPPSDIECLAMESVLLQVNLTLLSRS